MIFKREYVRLDPKPDAAAILAALDCLVGGLQLDAPPSRPQDALTSPPYQGASTRRLSALTEATPQLDLALQQ